MGPQVIRADGLRVSDLLQAIIPLFELDSCAAGGDDGRRRRRCARPDGGTTLSAGALSAGPCPDIVRIDRFAFYDRAQKPLRSLSQESALSTEISF